MSDHTARLGSSAASHAPTGYVKIWAVLCALLIVSVLGPFAGVKIVTLITAFGVALVKAYLVAKHFMHLGIERRYIVYLLATALAFVALLYAGVSPDVMEHRGRNWTNAAAEAEVSRALSAQAEGEGR